jgi:nucleoside-diphosphate-sugar epimerase
VSDIREMQYNPVTQKDSPVLVTGGAGYIGSALVGQLLQEGYRVRVLDNLMHGGRALLAFWGHPKFELHHGDIRSESDVARALKDTDKVVHLAAIVGDPACRRYPDLAAAVNRDGSQTVCRLAIDHGVSRFVFASTCSNYGRMSNPDGFVNEESPLNPISLYAELKVGFEHFLLDNGGSGFHPTCLRFATAYGLTPRPRFDLTVNEFTRELYLNRKLEVFGKQFWRPYCHAVDLARACVLVSEADAVKVHGQAFNVGDSTENYRKRDLVELILRALPDRRGNVAYVQRAEDPRDYRVNFDKVARVLAFAVSRKVVDGIGEVVFALESGLIQDPDDIHYRNL